MLWMSWKVYGLYHQKRKAGSIQGSTPLWSYCCRHMVLGYAADGIALQALQKRMGSGLVHVDARTKAPHQPYQES